MNRIYTFIFAGLISASMNVGAATPHSVDAANPSVSENFNSMWDETASEGSLRLPAGWVVDRNLTAPRTVGKWSEASAEVMYSGGVSLASNAKNGTWNFGSSSDNSDRAIGGLTTTVSNGTRGVSLMTALTNNSDVKIDRLEVSYNIEKYRKGANAAGFAVQLYYSTDGEKWTSAGDSFHNHFEADDETLGAEIVPISVTEVSPKWLMADVAPGGTIYLAWNISVASGDAAQGAPALAIDNVRFEGSLPEVPETRYRIYVNNQTTWDAIGLYAWGDGEIFGTWPGQAPIDEVENEGVRYTVFGLDVDGGSYNLIFNNWNNNKQLPDYNITADRDHWLYIDDNGVKEQAPTMVETIAGNIEGMTVKGNVLDVRENLPIAVFTTDGRRVKVGQGPLLDLNNLPRGLFIAVTPKASKKIVLK